MRLAAFVLSLAILLSAAPCRGEDGAPYFPIEVYVDAGEDRLAAYQLEIQLAGAEIVGVEGGEHTAFGTPPYYDPAALRGSRIKLAALSTARDLPSGRTRIATLHIREVGPAPATWTVSSSLATDSAAKAIDVRVELVAAREEHDR